MSVSATIWFIVSLALLFTELMLPGFFFIWVGLGAFATSILVYFFPDVGLFFQIGFSCFFFFFSIILSQLYIKKYPPLSERPSLNKWADQYMERTFYLTDPIHYGRCQVRLDGSVWNVSGKDCPAGIEVKIVKMDGLLLIVEPVTKKTAPLSTE